MKLPTFSPHVIFSLGHLSSLFTDDAAADRDARLTGWREAKLGRFIHWVLSAIPANGEWHMRKMLLADASQSAPSATTAGTTVFKLPSAAPARTASTRLALAFLANLTLSLVAMLPAASAAETNPELDRIYQFFIASGEADRPNLGAYLWIPPKTPKIRAVMIGMHNGLPINILQSAPVRAVCRKHGIAQILFTPWAKDIGGVMMKDLTFDVTDPGRTAIYDGYLQNLADLSEHPELIAAPIVPLGHSAVCGFAFEAAIRQPEKCLGSIPIKAGLPDIYSFFGAGGKALHPNADMALRNVPILFVNSASQETVSWSAFPHAMGTYGLGSYRRDHEDNPGTGYEPRNDLFGACWEMSSGHFDMLPRNYQFVAEWIDAIATARLPAKAGEPLKNLTLRDGWLMSPKIPAAGELPKDYPMPAPYLEYTGHRNEALWFPNEKLAHAVFAAGHDEPRKKIELFTLLDAEAKPIDLAHGRMAPLSNPGALLHDDGLLTLTTHRFTTPPDICTVKDKDHAKHPEQPHAFENVLFPGQTTLPVSQLPLRFDAHGGGFELLRSEQFIDDRGVTETRFTLRLKRHRIAPGAGFNMSFVRVFHEGSEEFSAAGRTCQISLASSDVMKSATAQTVEFPPVPDAPATTAKIELHAKSSAGLPVDYFVLKGPGLIKDGAFIPTEVPTGTTKPIEVTAGAYQVGKFNAAGGIKPSETVYQTFYLTAPFPKSN